MQGYLSFFNLACEFVVINLDQKNCEIRNLEVDMKIFAAWGCVNLESKRWWMVKYCVF